MKKLTKDVMIMVFGVIALLLPLFTVAFASTDVSTTKWGEITVLKKSTKLTKTYFI